MHKYAAGVLFIGLVVALMIIITSRVAAPTPPRSSSQLQHHDYASVQLHVAEAGFSKVRYDLSRAADEAAKERGLSGRSDMPATAGMLFPYDRVDEQCFWMKDMHFPLDIIWLDKDKRVVHIEKDLAPDTYPQTYCTKAQYVIELNAGETTRSGIKTGVMLNF